MQHGPTFSEKLVMPQKSMGNLMEKGEGRRSQVSDKKRKLEDGQMQEHSLGKARETMGRGLASPDYERGCGLWLPK